TRSYGDWSSDVCSSDLHARFTSVELVRRGEELVADAHVHRQVALRRPVVLHVEADEVLTPAASGRRSRRLPLVGVRPVQDEILRSEERRVGKEGRVRRV